MTPLINSLLSICKNNTITEKILITSSLKQGHQTVLALAMNGIPTLNLRPATVKTVALEIAGLQLLKKKLKPIPDLGLSFLMEDIFVEVSKKKDSYFRGLETGEGIVDALASSVQALRMYGLSSKELKQEAFVDQRKGRDLKEILSRYEKYLQKEGFYDYPELLQITMKVLAEEPLPRNNLYILPSDMPFAPLERNFLDALSGEKIVIQHDKPVGLATPVRYIESTAPISLKECRQNSDRLRWLFDPASSPKPLKDESIAIFHGMGKRNEVREVFRRIILSGAKGDEVEIVHTSYDSFVPLIRSVSSKLGVRVSFDEGLPAITTRPGRALSGYLSWIESDFEAIRLRRLISSGAVSFASGDKDIKSNVLGKVLIESQIGWGRDRYLPTLKDMVASFRDKKESTSGEHIKYLDILEKNTGFLMGIVQTALQEIPEPKNDATVDLNSLCRGASNFITRFSSVKDDMDAEAKKIITEALDEAAETAMRDLPLKDALSRIESLIQNLRVGQSGPVPGRIHVSSYQSGWVTGRKNIFVIGCEQSLFPGTTLQDPILLDEERMKLDTSLSRSSDRLKENLYRMASLLASLEGKITFSYSSFDVPEGKDSFPSSIILQAFRLMTGNSDADYSILENALGRPAGYRHSLERALDSSDFWIGQVATDDGMKHARPSMLSCYPEFAAGLRASAARESDLYTAYDGVLTSANRLDPVESRRAFSATELENAAKCPLRYFLESVLGASDIDELTRKPGEWLEARDRGTLLHEIYAEFMIKLMEKGDKPSGRKHLAVILEIAEKLIEEMRKKLPAPSEAVYQQEKRAILKAAEFFLRMEEERCKKVEPVLFEAQFGRKESLSIDIGGKNIFIKGRIDRVDRVAPNEYEIWDYKSGSSAKYRGDSILNGGKELQPGLYSIAAELILRSDIDKNAKVKRAGYLFPTEKGGGIERGRMRDDKSLKEVVGLIMDMMSKGFFIYTDDERDCVYCDYKAACCEPNVKGKYEKGNSEASLLRRLRAYV